MNLAEISDHLPGDLATVGIYEKQSKRRYERAGNRMKSETADGEATYYVVRELKRKEHRRFAANNAEKGENVGCYFYGTKGTFMMVELHNPVCIGPYP